MVIRKGQNHTNLFPLGCIVTIRARLHMPTQVAVAACCCFWCSFRYLHKLGIGVHEHSFANSATFKAERRSRRITGHCRAAGRAEDRCDNNKCTHSLRVAWIVFWHATRSGRWRAISHSMCAQRSKNSRSARSKCSPEGDETAAAATNVTSAVFPDADDGKSVHNEGASSASRNSITPKSDNDSGLCEIDTYSWIGETVCVCERERK